MPAITLKPAPPSVIASWPMPNYVNPETRGPALGYVCIIFSALGIVAVIARLYSRLYMTRAPGLDDFLVVFALLFAMALAVLVIIGNKLYYSGRHVWDIPISAFKPHRLNVWVSMWCYVTAAALVKISVLLFYRRLSVKFSRAFLIATWIGIVYNILYWLGFGLALLLMCNPIYAYWTSFDPEWAASHSYRCQEEGIAIPASAGFSVLGDLYSTLLPVLLIYNLGLPRRQKFALYALFALGFLAVAAGIVRTVLLDVLLNKNYDFTWILWETWIWGMVELYVAIFAASAPALKPFFQRFFIESLGSIARSSRVHGDSRWNAGDGPQKGTWVSEVSKDGGIVDVERIGVAYDGTEPESRERGFMRDLEDEETRHYELRASRDGKIIPMQVYKSSVSSTGRRSNPFSDHERTVSTITPPTEDWPMPPAINCPGPTTQPSRRNIPSQTSQQTIHVGLQIERPLHHSSSRGSITMARLRAPSPMNPRSFEHMHDELASGSRLESPSDSDDGSIYGYEKPPWNTIKTSSSIQTRERSDSDETLHLPRMGSRGLAPEKSNSGKMPVGSAL
ncbi:uncharacterized protein Z518_01716 [Rhinocladiella mackenziei CBS 650.93]|uniref:Rhodopsin domain-containing protein n=1 Tax=Rhinocladiella mackenziei CBS 650.93 TaxID=1442369 RepID=A0A0D2G6P3_9EURO|nr:uncharacterized protein Z518_01716 [Rhinocladiella mackenziei CBS 650.93]KIX10632.1 hypothetical protein Z518_01716 [Rhinocladiella mackenziei CBS 650.93]